MASLYQVLSQIPVLSSFLSPPHLTTPNIINNNTLSSSILNPAHCPNPPALSCPSPPPPQDINTCCLNHPSGHFLQTQFWDTAPPIGPNNSWTIHGLWPDLCTGGFDAFCDSSRSHSDIRNVLRHALEDRDHDGNYSETIEELLSFMETYWLSLDGDHEHLWAHEWNKHGTCISTLEPDCYAAPPPSSNYRHRHLDVLDYFIHTTSLFRTLDTYAILAEAGILPSSHKQYTLRELEDAIQSSAHGHPVTFRCNYHGELDEVWYHFAVKGSLRHTSYAQGLEEAASSDPEDSKRDMYISPREHRSPFLNETAVRQHFVPVPPDGAISNCPRRGIKYLPKDADDHVPPSPSKTTTTISNPTASPTSTSTAAPFTGRGHLEIHILDSASASASPTSPSPQIAQNHLLAPALPDSGPSLSSSLLSSTSLKKGCLIRQGQWYVSGTCATFRAQHDVVDPGHQALFSLSSSFSPCLINPATARFECTNSATVQGIFSYAENNDGINVLAYHNRSVFYAHRIPKRFEKVDLFADDGNGERHVQVEIHWVPA